MVEDYQTDIFRSEMVKKLEAAITEQGGNFRYDPRNMESQAFARAKSRDEYIQYLSKMIMMIRNGAQPRPQGQGANPQQGQPRQPMMGQQQPQQQQQMGPQQGQGANVGGQGGMMPQYPVPPQQLNQGPQDQQQQMMMQQQNPPIINRMAGGSMPPMWRQRMPMQGNVPPGQMQGQRMTPGHPQGMRPGPGGGPNQQVPPNYGPPPNYQSMPQGNMPQRPPQPARGGVLSPSRAPSPAAQQMSPLSNPRSVGGLAPSPMQSIATPQGHSQDSEDAYTEKIKQLSKYIEPLSQMIAGISNNAEEKQKLGKMNKLMDILSNPSKRMPMSTLLKCEQVLEKMLNPDGGDGQSQTASQAINNLSQVEATPAISSTMNPLLDAVIKLKSADQKCQAPGSIFNHTLSRSLGEPLDAMFGSDITIPHLPKKYREMDLEEDSSSSGDGGVEIPDILQGEVARLQPQFKVTLDPAQPVHCSQNILLICQLEDKDLPSVPPLTVTIPQDYPDSGSITCGSDEDLVEYEFTPFLQKVKDSLQARLSKMPRQYSLSQLLSAWEMSVRAACSTKIVPVTRDSMLMGL